MTDAQRVWTYFLAHPKIPAAAVRATKLALNHSEWQEAVAFARQCFLEYLLERGVPEQLTPEAEQKLNSQAINRIRSRLIDEHKHRMQRLTATEAARVDPTNTLVQSERMEATFVQRQEEQNLWLLFIEESHLTARQRIILEMRDQKASQTEIAKALHVSRQTVYRDVAALKAYYYEFADRHHLRKPR